MEQFKKFYLNRLLVALFLLLLINIITEAANKQPFIINDSEQSIATLLDWRADANRLCGGYFFQPPELSAYPNPLPYNQETTQINAAGPSVLVQEGESILQKEVLVTQPGRIIEADQARIYRNAKGKITYIHLSGHVRLHEHGKLVATTYGHLDLVNHSVELGPAAYHIFGPSLSGYQTYDAWGLAQKAMRDNTSIIQLWQATYTTCSPNNHPVWQLQASYIRLNQEEGVGAANNVILRFADFPILYAPYLTFPIDKRRKSGWLLPTFGYADENGFTVSLPYYFNLAPNYDFSFTPKFITERGLQIDNLFRYLTASSEGEIYLSYLPDDHEFDEFRQQSIANASIDVPAAYLTDLRNDSNNRTYLHMQNDTMFNDEWQGHLRLNYVSDDYYFKDFGATYSDVTANQLLNQLDLEYSSDHWQAIALLQAYQTLHLIDQFPDPAIQQYQRLPEFDATASYPESFLGNDFYLSSQFVNFLYHSQFEPTTDEQPLGVRLHLRPAINHPLNWSFGYLTPQIALDSTTYSAQMPIPEDDLSRPNFNGSRTLPILSLDTGLYLDNFFEIGSSQYMNTLEPRLFYLYVPYLNQNKYPLFDTQLLPFSFTQVFAYNRFIGVDRLENANQVSAGITSRLLDRETTQQKLKADIGIIYYFESPKVCLDTDCSLTEANIPFSSHLSPLVAQLTYSPLANLDTTASYAWNSAAHRTDNANIAITYHDSPLQIATFGYQMIQEQNFEAVDEFGLSNNTNLIYGGFSWPLSKNWTSLGYAYYNFSKKRYDSYYAGIQYDACCWAFRILGARSFTSVAPESTAEQIIYQYKTSFFVQLQLKGLGTISNSNPSGLLNSTIPGFQDQFIW